MYFLTLLYRMASFSPQCRYCGLVQMLATRPLFRTTLYIKYIYMYSIAIAYLYYVFLELQWKIYHILYVMSYVA